MVVTAKSPHFDFYKQEVDRAIKDCKMWSDKVRLIVYTTVITETCDERPFGWLNYTNPREPQFRNFNPNDGDPPNKSWSTQRSGGLYQQQPQYWGPDVMDPYKSTVSFLTGYRFPDGRTAAGLIRVDWQNLPIEKACQAVQGSEFGDGSNYKRNIPYAQMVIDSTNNQEGCLLNMAQYNDADDFMDRSSIPYGIDAYEDPNARRESLRHSIWAINAAVFKNIPEAIANATNGIVNTINGIRSGIVDDILVNRRWYFLNQDGVPEKDQGTNNLVESVNATNGRVYHPMWGNKALSDKLDLVVQLLQEIEPDNKDIAALVKKYNSTHVAVVPVRVPVDPPVILDPPKKNVPNTEKDAN